jgi:hypothetical protein
MIKTECTTCRCRFEVSLYVSVSNKLYSELNVDIGLIYLLFVKSYAAKNESSLSNCATMKTKHHLVPSTEARLRKHAEHAVQS